MHLHQIHTKKEEGAEVRPIKFRAWDNFSKKMYEVYQLDFNTGYRQEIDPVRNVHVLTDGQTSINNFVLMQFTGLHDNSIQLKEIYEGDIIDAEGKLKGNIYESPQIYEEGTDWIIASMGTKEWRNTESVAMGCGCKYTEQLSS